MSEEIIVRLAQEDDVKKVFDLSNDKLVRANSINTQQIAWDSHVKWFAEKIKDKDVYFFVAEATNGDFIGQVRLAKEENEWIVSISICEKWRGKGLGYVMLTKARENAGLNRIVAYVQTENIPSLKMFQKAGYIVFKTEKINNIEYQVLSYDK